MTDVQATVPEPNLDQFFKENIAFIKFYLSKMVANHGLPKGMDVTIRYCLTLKPDSVGALINSCLTEWSKSLPQNRRRKPDNIEKLERGRNNKATNFGKKLNALFSEVLGTNGVLDLRTPIDLGALRKLSGLKEVAVDPSVYACLLSLGENPYRRMMEPVEEGGLQEIIEARVIAYAAQPNNNGIGPETLPLILAVLPEIGGKTLAQAEVMFQEKQQTLDTRNCEKTRKNNCFSKMMEELCGISNPDDVIDAKGLLRLLKIPDDGYSIKAAESAVKANLEPQAEGPAQQQASEAITTSQGPQEDYREFLKENKAFIRYTLSQHGGLGTIKGEGGLDVLLKCLERLGDRKSPTVGDLIFEFRTYGTGRHNETQQLQVLLSNALERQDQPDEKDSTLLDLNVLKKLCGMKDGERDPSVRVCMMCGAEESYTALLSPVEEGGFGEIIASAISRLAQSSRRNQVGEKMLGIILEALPHIGGKSLSDAAGYIALPQWGRELCARLNSDQSSQENDSLNQAVKSLLNIEGKISEGVFLGAIQSKPSLKGSLKTFHEELTSAMGSNVPIFLKWEKDDKEQQSTRTKAGKDFSRQSPEWFGVNNQQGTFDEKALLRVLEIPEDGYSMELANYQQQNFLCQGYEL